MAGRRAIGVELKPSYYRQARKNIEAALRDWREGAHGDQAAIEFNDADDDEPAAEMEDATLDTEGGTR